jgi:hypothetical protein
METEIKIKPDELIWEYHRLHQKIFNDYELKSLRGFKNECILNGRPLLAWHHDATWKCSAKYNGQFNHQKNFDDILFCSEELLYFTASLYLYRPYINNPLKQAFPYGGEMIYPNYQNHYAKMYSMFANIASQIVYNYWDRVGDMIASFFPDKIDPTRVFFTTALDTIPDQFHSSENYLWLDNFRRKDYKELNEKRKQVVHYTTTETDYKYKHLEKGSKDKEAMEKIQAEREAIPEFYKKHIDLTLEGMAQTLSLLEEISNTLFTDIS